jgi:hypothetical protein
MPKMLHNIPHRPITTTPRLKPFEFLDIPHSFALSGWVGLSWVLGFRVVVSCCCCLILDFKNNLFGLNFDFSIFLVFDGAFDLILRLVFFEIQNFFGSKIIFTKNLELIRFKTRFSSIFITQN